GDRVRSLSLSRLPERRSSLLSIGLWILGLAAVTAGGWYGYQQYFQSKAVESTPAGSPTAKLASTTKPGTAVSSVASPTGNDRSTASTGINHQPPAKGDVALEAKGYIVPAHQILVSPKVSGMIVQLNVEEGRRVTKGDVLAVLESTDYAADLERAKATVRLMREKLRELENGNRPEEIKEAEADLHEAEATIPQLEAEYKRTADLRRRGSATPQEFEVAESKYL